METPKFNLKHIPWWVYVFLLVFVIVTSYTIWYMTNSGTTYYKQLYNEQTVKYNDAQKIIDSLEIEKKILLKQFVIDRIRIDSTLSAAGVIKKNQIKTKYNYEKTINTVNNWSVDQLDSFFANSSGQKNR